MKESDLTVVQITDSPKAFCNVCQIYCCAITVVSLLTLKNLKNDENLNCITRRVTLLSKDLAPLFIIVPFYPRISEMLGSLPRFCLFVFLSKLSHMQTFKITFVSAFFFFGSVFTAIL